MVGRKFNISEEKLKELYREVKVKTNNFKTFEPLLLSENSQRIIVFRLALGMSCEKFANLCKRSRGSIQNLERTPKQLNYNVAFYYTDVIKNNLQNANFQLAHILQVFRKFKERAIKGVSVMKKEDILRFVRMGVAKAIRKRKVSEKEYFKASYEGVRSQPLTNQEKKIKALLDESKISYKLHEFVCGENVDFVIENPNKTILISCSSSKPSNLTHHARRLMYQAYRIKYHQKNKVFFIGILGKQRGTLKKSEIPFGAIKLLNEICDAWFVDENLNEFINFLKTVS